MKPERKPFVVEVKKRRSAPRKANAIWGSIDLKFAADQIRNEELTDNNRDNLLDSANAGSDSNNEAA